MRALLFAVRDHLQDTWEHVEVGEKPAGVPDSLPYATVWLTGDLPFENTNTDQDIDVSLDATVQVKAIGSSFAQASLLADTLDSAIRDGLTITGYGVHLVQRLRAQGPIRDADVFPAPHSWYVDRWYQVWYAPDDDVS